MVSYKVISFGHNISSHLVDFVLNLEFLMKQQSFIVTFSKNTLDDFNIASNEAKANRSIDRVISLVLTQIQSSLSKGT